jgi:predicted CoA-binding protein
MNDPDTILAILRDAKTIAVVGLSGRPERPGYYVPAYLQSQGYRIIPVNPYVPHVLGEKSYPALKDVPEPVDVVLLFQRSEKTPPFVDQAIELGAKAVWMQSGIRNEAAAEKARQAGLQVVQDACMMVEHRRYKALKSMDADKRERAPKNPDP